jgi:hypothetical protein
VDVTAADVDVVDRVEGDDRLRAKFFISTLTILLFFTPRNQMAATYVPSTYCFSIVKFSRRIFFSREPMLPSARIAIESTRAAGDSVPDSTSIFGDQPGSCKIPPMPPTPRRPAYRLAVLLAALAFLLPLAAIAGACTDCLWGAPQGSQDCCPPSCCSCCAHSPSVLTASVWMALVPSPAAAMPEPQENSYPSLRSRDIFHVPKSSPL